LSVEYHVIYDGVLQGDLRPEDISEQIRDYIGFPVDDLHALLTGGPKLLAVTQDHSTAQKRVLNLQKYGLMVSIETVEAIKVSPNSIASHTPAHPPKDSPETPTDLDTSPSQPPPSGSPVHGNSVKADLDRPEPEADTRELSFEFDCDGKAYFRFWIENYLFSIVTLGLYSAVAKVQNNKFLYSRVKLDGHSFEYIGGPGAIF
jgi:hypothetical protein